MIIILLPYTRKNSNDEMNENIYFIDINYKSSKILATYPNYAASSTKIIDMENFEIMIGGFKGSDASNEIILLRVNVSISDIKLPESLAAHDAAHIGNKIFIYGGVYSINNIVLNLRATSMFIKISEDEFDCSPDFFSKSCEICPKGTYSVQAISQHCSNCTSGTYSSDIGLTLPNQCLLCPYGTVQGNSGKSYCYSCSVPSDCRFKTIAPKIRKAPINILSIQPDKYDTNQDLADERNLILIFCVISLIIFIFITYLFKRTQKRFRLFYIYLKEDIIENTIKILFLLIMEVIFYYFYLSRNYFYCFSYYLFFNCEYY